MSDTTYLIIQTIVLVCYASWVAYRIGRTHGENDILNRVKSNQRKYNIFKTWKDIK